MLRILWIQFCQIKATSRVRPLDRIISRYSQKTCLVLSRVKLFSFDIDANNAHGGLPNLWCFKEAFTDGCFTVLHSSKFHIPWQWRFPGGISISGGGNLFKWSFCKDLRCKRASPNIVNSSYYQCQNWKTHLLLGSYTHSTAQTFQANWQVH